MWNIKNTLENTMDNLIVKFLFDFDKAKGIVGKYSQVQVDSINAIFKEINSQKITQVEQAAYILATAWHESRFTPTIEWGGEKYLKSKKYYPYYGRGFVQCTWDYNYKSQGDRLGIDLINNPDKALEIPIAANILVYGMKHGSFTGKKLSNYISKVADYRNARKIINGMDKASLIASLAKQFEICIFKALDYGISKG